MTPITIVWALINSVWQSAAIFAAVGVFTRIVKLSASQRHALWFSALFAAAALPFANLTMPARPIPVHLPTYVTAEPATVPRVTLQAVTRHVATLSTRPHIVPKPLAQTPDPASILLFLCLGVIAALGLRLGYGYVRLRIAKVALIDDARLTARALELGPVSRRKVRAGISAQLSEPCVIGFSDPCIAVPAALATSLSQADLDRILRHECAHIARYDDYSNLLRQVIRAVLFFNPFVHAIAHAVALEAEIACDDAAALAERERVAFAKCLYELARAARGRYSPAAGFFGSRRQIGSRVARLLERNHASSPRLTVALKAAAALVVLSALALGSLRVTTLAAVAHESISPKIASVPGFGSRDVTIASEPALAVPKNSSLTAQPVTAVTPSNLTAPATAPARVHVLVRRSATRPAVADVSTMVARNDGDDLVDALAAAGYRGLSPDDLIELNNHGVTSDFINALHARGIGPLSVRTLVALVDHGVTVDFISAVRDAGYGEPDPEMLVRLADHGVTPDYLRAVDAASGTRLSLDDLTRMADAGVSEDLVRQLAGLGYRGISAHDYVRMANAGVTPQFVKRIIDSHLTGGRPSVDQLIELANAGV